jgi:predicted branched-subunit amino acid permease
LGAVSRAFLLSAPPSSPLDSDAARYPRAYPSRAAAFFGGVREVVSATALVLGASYIGLGSLLRELGLGIELGYASTLTIWALPGQVASIELFAIGAPLISVFIAVSLINFRFLPMVVSLLPLLRERGRPPWRFYVIAHFVAVSAWVLVMLRSPEMPPSQRLPYFFGCTVVLIGAAFTGTTIGYLAAAVVAPEVSLGLVFLNPVFFMLVLLVDLRQRARVLALLFGAVAGPALHLLTPTWGLLIAGLLAGTAAFVADRHLLTRGASRG